MMREAAAGPLAGTPFDPAWAGTKDEAAAYVRGFRDGMGHRRRVDRPVLAWALGVDPGADPGTGVAEEGVWWALHGEGAVLTRVAPAGAGGAGPLLPQRERDGLEVWSEAELSALHAVSWRTGREAGAWGRCVGAARWLMAEVQPDNATNRPWAAHVFARLAADGGAEAAEAGHYAETLLHNAMIPAGRPDVFSACILWDSARWLARGGD